MALGLALGPPLLWLALLFGALLLLPGFAELLEAVLAGVLFGDFLPAGASSLELSEDDKLELDSFLAAPLLPETVVLAAAGVLSQPEQLSFLCCSWLLQEASVQETSELEEVDGDRAAPLILAGLALGIGVDVLGGCSVHFHLVAAGPGSGCHCVRTS